jgi:glucoamylase
MAVAAVLPGTPVRARPRTARLPAPLTLGLCLALLLTAGGVVLARVAPQDADVPLASETVAVGLGGTVGEVLPGARTTVPGTP